MYLCVLFNNDNDGMIDIIRIRKIQNAVKSNLNHIPHFEYITTVNKHRAGNLSCLVSLLKI